MPQFKEVFEPMGADAEGSGDVRNTEWLMNVMEQHCIDNGGALTVGELVEAVARLLCSKSNSDAIQVFCQPVCVHRSHMYAAYQQATLLHRAIFDSNVWFAGRTVGFIGIQFRLNFRIDPEQRPTE